MKIGQNRAPDLKIRENFISRVTPARFYRPRGPRIDPDPPGAKKKVKKFILDKGFDEKFGARPLKRVIQKYIEDPFAEEIILGKVKEGDKIKIDYNEKKDLISLTIKN